MSAEDASRDRSADVELLAAEISALRDAARRYGQAVDAGHGIGGACRDLEDAAIQYVHKLDEELWKSQQVDYGALFEETRRRQRN